MTANFAPSAISLTTGALNIPAHGLAFGQPITFATTGALPNGLNTTETFYAIPLDANNISVAVASTDLSGGVMFESQGSGTHTVNG